MIARAELNPPPAVPSFPCVGCGLWTHSKCRCFWPYHARKEVREGAGPGFDVRTPFCLHCQDDRWECHLCREVPWVTPRAWPLLPPRYWDADDDDDDHSHSADDDSTHSDDVDDDSVDYADDDNFWNKVMSRARRRT